MMRDGKHYKLLGLRTNKIKGMRPISKKQLEDLKNGKKLNN